MILKGEYASADVKIDCIDPTTTSQIYSFLRQEIFKDAKIKIMPDCHAGAGAVIGFTMGLKDFVIPNIIGVDLSCGIYAYNLGKTQIDFKEFDSYLRSNVPSGFSTHQKNQFITHESAVFDSTFEEICEEIIDKKERKASLHSRFISSLGTLGGGKLIASLVQ